jgi:hypothetical protein
MAHVASPSVASNGAEFDDEHRCAEHESRGTEQGGQKKPDECPLIASDKMHQRRLTALICLPRMDRAKTNQSGSGVAPRWEWDGTSPTQALQEWYRSGRRLFLPFRDCSIRCNRFPG